jgi:hypothetical protein
VSNFKHCILELKVVDLVSGTGRSLVVRQGGGLVPKRVLVSQGLANQDILNERISYALLVEKLHNCIYLMKIAFFMPLKE